MMHDFDDCNPYREAYKAAIQRVRELHFEYYGDIADTYCGHCGTQYPCDTIRALDGEQA